MAIDDLNFDGLYLKYSAGRLEAMLLEAKGCWEEAENAYSSLLEDNPLDQVSFNLFWLTNTLLFLITISSIGPFLVNYFVWYSR